MIRDGSVPLLNGRPPEEMPLLFMDCVCRADSPEESHGDAPGPEREGAGQQAGQRGSKRRERSRDATSESRRKQTRRADELHKELEHLEQSNSTLEKEIAQLKRHLHLYRRVLKGHEPSCRLRAADGKSKSRQGAAHGCSSLSASACLSATDGSSLKESSDVTPPSTNGPRPPPGHFGGDPASSEPPRSHLLSNLQDSVLQSISTSPLLDPELPRMSAFSEESSYSQGIAPHPTFLLSLLAIPSQLAAPATTSIGSDVPRPQPLTSLPAFGNLSDDLSFSRLLEDNDWILQ